jgi:hypothetical protein
MGRYSTKSKVVMMCNSIPADVRAWLESEAERALAPMNSIIVQTLRAKMEAQAREERTQPADDAA